MAVRSLRFVLSGEDKSATSALDKVGRKTDNLKSKFGGMAGAIAGGAVGAGLASFAKGSVAAFKESEQSQAALQGAFAKFPKLADTNMGALQKLNGELAKKTKYDDDALASGQSVLAQFNLTGKQVESVTPLLADYASRTGQDLPSAATALGKAFGGNAKALKAIGINYKSTGDKSKDFANIQALLSAKVGGFATREGKTASGQAAILGNQYGELQETVGAKLVPVLSKLAGWLLKIVDFVQRNSAVIGPLVAVVAGIAAGVKLWAISQAILNSALLANPLGLVVVAIAALAAGLIYAYKHSETFRNIVNGVFSAVGKAAGVFKTVVVGYIRLVAKVWLTIVGALVNGAAKAFGWVPGIGPKLKAAASKFNEFKDKVNDSLAGINETKTITIKAVSSTVAQKAANAGIASGALSGSEAAASVTTRSGARAGKAAGSGTTVVNVHNTVDKRGITTMVTSQQQTNTRFGHKPGFAS